MSSQENARMTVVGIQDDKKDGYTRPEMTEEDIQAAQNLRNLWKVYKAKHKITQAEFVGPLGWTQGNFSQYLTAKVPVGMKALLKLSDALECDPGDIRSELRDNHLESRHNQLASQLHDAISLLKELGGDNITSLVDNSENLLDRVQLAVA